jgi:hypothetical protein
MSFSGAVKHVYDATSTESLHGHGSCDQDAGQK